MTDSIILVLRKRSSVLRHTDINIGQYLHIRARKDTCIIEEPGAKTA